MRNVELPLKSQSVPAYECREKAEQALGTVGLGHCVEYPLDQLSAAQRQLVSIARALVNDPSVIFLDEPTRGLDSTSREELMGLLQKLNDQGRTIVMTTKDPVEARYCLRMVKLGEGKILENILVSKRRIVPSSKVPGTVPKSHEREVAFCPRCNYSNFKDQEVCGRCECPLEFTDDEVESIEGRLSGSNNAHLGVEDDIEEEEEPQGGIDNMVNELKEIPFFAGLGHKSLTRIIPSLEEVSYSRRSTIIRQGEVGDSFYVIRSGNVRVVREVDDAAPTHLAELGPNEGFGEMALLTDEPRSAMVVAKTDVEVWRLSREAFEGLLAENLSLAVYFNRILRQRLRTLQEKIVPYS